MEDLISKKEVLEKYGISYGALYRWEAYGSHSGSVVHSEIHSHRSGDLLPSGSGVPPGGADPCRAGMERPWNNWRES